MCIFILSSFWTENEYDIVFSAYVQLYVVINYMNLNLYSKCSDIYVFSDVISVELWSPNLQSHLRL